MGGMDAYMHGALWECIDQKKEVEIDNKRKESREGIDTFCLPTPFIKEREEHRRPKIIRRPKT